MDLSKLQILLELKTIDPEILPRLFQKFATKSDKGTGLGLYISKNIIEAHGEKIWGVNNDKKLAEPDLDLLYQYIRNKYKHRK